MLDVMIGYTGLAIIWAIYVEILNMKGKIAKIGFILFFPFIAIQLGYEVIANEIKKDVDFLKIFF